MSDNKSEDAAYGQYDQLLETRQEYGPSFSMIVYNDEGTESCDHDLNSVQ